MSRSNEEVFAAHVAAVGKGDIAGILNDYAEDAVLLTSRGAIESRSGIEGFFSQTLAALPQVELSATSAVFGGNALLLNWTASSPAGRINDGVDTFVFADGLIQVQTSSFTLVLKETL